MDSHFVIRFRIQLKSTLEFGQLEIRIVDDSILRPLLPKLIVNQLLICYWCDFFLGFRMSRPIPLPESSNQVQFNPDPSWKKVPPKPFLKLSRCQSRKWSWPTDLGGAVKMQISLASKWGCKIISLTLNGRVITSSYPINVHGVIFASKFQWLSLVFKYNFKGKKNPSCL